MRNLLLLLLCLLGGAVLADGFLVPASPDAPAFSVKYHRVKVAINRQVATTEVDQAFHNHAKRQIEGTYIFPIADGMSISKFSMYTGGEELTHRILEKEEARRIYNGIVSKRRDPALLEWLGSRMIQARVFPIEPDEDKRITLTYQEVLAAQNGTCKYVYPLKTEKVSAKPLEECRVEVVITSEAPIRSVYSPTHPITVTREGEHKARVLYQEKNVLPDQDLVLYYTVSEDAVSANLLTYRDPQHGDGYFLLLAAPKVEVKQNEVIAKDVVFVLDTSGSMSGEKIEQAKGALKYCIDSLDEHDRFNVVAYSTDIRPWKDSLQPARAAERKDALAFVKEFSANGGTNIHDALKTALGQFAKADEKTTRTPVVVFLTDGLPTVGETNTDTILAVVRKTNAARARLFEFGVGADYNAHFLDKLAEENNGYSDNVLPKEDIEVKVSDFYGKIATPLLMNLALDWGGAKVYDIYPQQLPDLYKGSQLIIAGRYKPVAAAMHTLKLTGEVGGKKQSFSYPIALPDRTPADEYIARLWATRKIGFLENQLRLHGTNQELLQSLIALSKEYGILSQYTSFLVDLDVPAGTEVDRFGNMRGPQGPKGEPGAPGGAAGAAGASGPRPATTNIAKDDTYLAREAGARVTVERAKLSGGSAVAQSVNSKTAMNAVTTAPTTGMKTLTEAGDEVQLSQMRNVAQRSFVQTGRQWVDINYRAEQKLVKVKAFSPAYFQLANSNTRLAKMLALDENVTITVKDTAIQVGPDGQDTEFPTKDFTPLKAKIDAELGVPVTMMPPAAPHPLLALATPSPAHRGIPLAFLGLAIIPVGLLVGLWSGKRKGQRAR